MQRINTLAFSLVLAVGAVLLTACSDDGTTGKNPVPAGRPVTFGSTIDARPAASWTAGQTAGVFMIKQGATLSTATVREGVNNVQFVTASNAGYFKPVSGTVSYPAEEVVDFIAYSPYHPAAGNGQVPMDVTDQSNQQALDLLYSNNVTSWSATKMEATLQFAPKMATLRINFVSSGTADLSRLTARLLNVPTRAQFDLATGSFGAATATGDVVMKVEANTGSASAVATLLPIFQGAKVEVTTAAGVRDTVDITNAFTPGVTVSTTTRIGAGGSISSTLGYTAWMETPLITQDQLRTPHLRYVTHYLTETGETARRNYSMLFNTQLRIAEWVAYPLYKGFTTKKIDRTDAWGIDPFFNESEQAVLTERGFGSGGFDRGHQIPSADRLAWWSANVQTFYGTNMTPQYGNLNQGVWAALENAVRSWANAVDTLYVVTGAAATTATDANVTYAYDNRHKPIAVPKYYYKAICHYNRQTGTYKTLAFKFDHNANYSKSDKRYMDRAISVAELERLTGYTFFPDVPGNYKQSTRWN